MAGRQSRGTCACCGAESGKGAMSRHLAACPERRKAIERADAGGGTPETLHSLRVEDEGSKAFWLDLEMPASATLKQLDTYLRAIWLECCGHLSRFSAGGWGANNVGMARKIGDVLQEGVTLTHTYDFGTSSYTLVRSLGTRTGVPTTRKPVALLARNRMPEAQCTKCENPAAFLCLECFQTGDAGTLCPAHTRKHPHRDYGPPLALVNSPRLGLCGYEGPADPPY